MSSVPPPGLDPGRLRGYLDRERPGLVSGPLSARLIQGGRSNLTYSVTDGTGRWVVRRPPLGHVLATAHDMQREHRAISALHTTAVPVPEPVLLCEDESVIGSPFYVMEFVDGTPYRTAEELAPLGPERTRDAVLSLVDTLVELHAVAPESVGLGDFGRPEGFLDRQLRRWGKQLHASRNRELAGIDELHAALSRELPASPVPTVIHGDYRLDNVLVGADDRIKAVLDWEMSTLGDPLTDIGMMFVYWPQAGEDRASTMSPVTTLPGFPTRAEVAERYAQRTGADLSDLNWYVGFAFFKFAAIIAGIVARSAAGALAGKDTSGYAERIDPCVELGRATLDDGAI
jgi:aminoglycoside phosphotransferase (APT) family kinase protein